MKMMMARTGLVAAALGANLLWPSGAAQNVNSSFDVFDYVDPFIGTSNGGHVFAGATLPFGMAKAVADTTGENQAGFASDDLLVYGFSHMHDSGTGGGASMGQFPIFPQAGCPGDDLDRCKWSSADRSVTWINGSDEAHPGYFAITLNSSIRAEMTVTNHTALYRFTFPDTPVPAYNLSAPAYPNITATNQPIPTPAAGEAAPLSPLILVELTDLPLSRTNGSAAVDPSTGRITGNGTFGPSFGIGSYDLHFCIDFQGAPVRDAGVWVNDRAGTTPTSVSVVPDGVNTPTPLPIGAFTRFGAPTTDNQILARVGVSFMGVDQACRNAETEVPDFDFNGTLAAAEQAWREKLGVISIDATGVSAELQTVFWSGVYRAMISPQDYTGENPLWESSEPYYDSYYCIWDSFRSIHPLLTLLDPVSQSRMLRSLVDIYRHEGYLPDCRMSLCKGFTQGGSNADVVLTDSFLKGIPDIDWGTAYAALLADAELEPANWGVEGRGGLASWKALNYIPTDDFDPYGAGPFTRSISRTVEYAYDDFCVAQMAAGLNRTGDYEKYVARAGNWKNMFNAEQTSAINGTDTGFVGFLQPRFLNGTWGFQDPAFCSPLLNFTSCYLNPDGHETYEGSSWLYTFFVPQDMASLITTLGGPSAFISRLTYLHTSGLLYIGDEQAFLPVFQFHYGGRPALSSLQAHAYIPSQFNTTLAGLAGNDDSGAMGSFIALAMLGLWPVSGQDVYLITPPFFPEANVTNVLTGAVATVRCVGFDPEYEAVYIQSVTRDGSPWTRSWVGYDFYRDGGVLELVLGRNESAWGTADEDLPPSLSTGGFAA